MTKQEAYRELRRYREEIGKAESYRRRLIELDGQIFAIKTTNYDVTVDGGQRGSNLEKLIDKIDDCKTELANCILRSEAFRKSIIKKLDTLEFPYSDVLWRRYINCDSFEKISVEMSLRNKQNYTYENIKQLNSRGVERYSHL